jgi:8-oxo-dGTP pyrophosphatase MutT (NUDIX family)
MGLNTPLSNGLHALLLDYTPSTPLEAQYLQKMLALAAQKNSTDRSNYVPGHFTASAFLLSPNQEEICLIYHGKLHLWLQPGGHIEPTDESVVAAARREVMEETGNLDFTLFDAQNPIFDLDIHTIPESPKRNAPAHDHFDVRMLFQAHSPTLVAGDDALDARWVPISEVQDAGTDQSVMRAVGKLRALLQI